MENDGRHRVLVCEDDALLRTTIERGLTRAGYRVDAVTTGGEAVRAARQHVPDAVVLDIGLPDSDGRDVCQALRVQGCDAGIVFLTARDHVDDVLSGFAVGGDDYLRKPFEFPELLARLTGVIRRRPVVQEHAERLWVDPAGHALRFGDRSAALTPTEFRFLACLIAGRERVVRRAELVAAAWPGSAGLSDNTLDQYVTRSRRKLREVGFPQTVENVRGVGYRLQ